jgi:hypothetical protein
MISDVGEGVVDLKMGGRVHETTPRAENYGGHNSLASLELDQRSAPNRSAG